ncbi:MAG TPA: PAS domain S-box protein [Roseimicrobium sp.]|nr:PAS domain S-box protein [Roseimicrobium sp.]
MREPSESATSDESQPAGSRLRTRAFRIAAIYAAFAMLWIYFSDRALILLVRNPDLLIRWSVYKGLGFVLITSALLLLLMWRAFGTIESGYALLKEKQQQLQANRAQLSDIISSAMDAIIVVDGKRRITLFNGAAVTMFGCPSAEALGQPVDTFVPELPDQDTVAGRIFEGRRRTGGTFPVEASVSRRGTGDGSSLTMILRDISERQAHEAEINRFKRLYAALSHINQSIAWTKTRTELMEQVCKVLCEHGGFKMAWMGWNDEELSRLLPVAHWGDEGDYLKTIQVRTDDSPEGRGPAGTAFREGSPQVSNDMLSDPSTAPWRAEIERRGLRSVAAFPIRERGKIRGLLCVYALEPGFFQDKEIALLTEAAADMSFALDKLAGEQERLEAEAAVRNEKLFSETMIESMPGILYFYDTAGRFLRWNRNFETVTGYSAEEIAGMHPLDFFTGADRKVVENKISEVFTRGESSVEAHFRARDGTTRPYFFTGRRVIFNDRTCLVGVGIDISERKRAEMALRVLNETLELEVIGRTSELHTALGRAEAADRIKSAFLATMSHELRTPLNSIIGFTGIVLQGLAGPLNAEQTKQLGMVRGSARHLLELINDVLDISKIEAGQLEVRAEPFDLAATIERVAASVKPMAEKKGLGLNVIQGKGPVEMTGDRRRVEQVLINLMNNAIKFTDRGEVTLTVDFPEKSPGTPVPSVRMRVKDTGMGIKSSDLSTLFQPFRQIDTGLSRQHEGTGLGLAICRRLVNLMGGEITAASEWTKGSEFTVVLPLQKQTAP